MRRTMDLGTIKRTLPPFGSLVRVGGCVGYVVGLRLTDLHGPWEVRLLETPGKAQWCELVGPVQFAPDVEPTRH